jgi:DNA-binding transcriptional MerR regulator
MYSMWMAELSARSGFSVATIKYYLREGLLHPGEATGATRTRYDESHVHRLRLIRALTEVAGLRLETVRQVLEGIDGARSWHEAVGSAHTRLGGPTDDDSPPSPASLSRVDALLARQGWQLAPGHPQARMLARALDALDGLDHPVGDTLLDLYAATMRPIAAHEVLAVRDPDVPEVERSVEAAVIGTLLQEPLLLGIRRIAQENVSRRLDEDEESNPRT